MESRRELTSDADGKLVSGDDLAAALEQYLADLDDKGKDEPGA